MWQTLFSWGPLTLRTFNIFLVVAFCLTAFLFWRRGREEHYQEDQLFDGFLVSFLFGLLAARAAYVLGNLSQIGTNIGAWFDLMGRPGLIGPVGFFVAAVMLFRFASRNKFDAYEILDMWSSAAALGMAVIMWGTFFHDSGWGLTLPSMMQFIPNFSLRFPLWLLSGILFGGLYIMLVRLEFRYRLINWYRNGHSVAQTGFLTAFGLIYSSLSLLVLTFLGLHLLPMGQIWAERGVYFIGALVGALILLSRSYRLEFLNFRKNRVDKK